MNYKRSTEKSARDFEPRLNSGIRMTSSHKKIAVTSQGHCRPNMVSKIPSSGDRGRVKRTSLTNYAAFLKRSPPAYPPNLLKSFTSNDDHVTNPSRRKEQPGAGKVKIMLRVSKDRSLEESSDQNSFIRVESNQKHVSVFTPGAGANKNNSLAPKVYAFDSVFTANTTQTEICTSSLTEVIPAVLQGADGTIFCYGQSNLGKTQVLMGSDSSSTDIGVIPCAISWLYRSIRESEKQGNCKFTVKVSAIEVYGRQEKLRDLLAGYSEDPTSPKALTVSEDPLMGVQLQNQCEIRASTPDRAAFYLDVALTSRSCTGTRNTPENRKHSHLIFTLNVFQSKPGDVEGKRSRLHFIDLGSCEKTLIKTPSSLALSLSSLGHVIMSIVNNSKHVPFRESKLTCVLREYLGNVNCRAVMLAHVSPDKPHYSDTLSTIQMASRIHRVIRKKNKCSGKENGYGHQMPRSKQLRLNSSAEDSIGSSSGMEYTSGSELSCDTIVYVNPNGVLRSDHELTDNESPPLMVPIPQNFQFQPQIPPVVEEEMVYNVRQAQIQNNDIGNSTRHQKNNIRRVEKICLNNQNVENGKYSNKNHLNSKLNQSNLPKKSSIPCSKTRVSRIGKPQASFQSRNNGNSNETLSSYQLNNFKSKQVYNGKQNGNVAKSDHNIPSKPLKPPRNMSESSPNACKPTKRVSSSIPKPMQITQLHGKEINKLSKNGAQGKSKIEKGIPMPPKRSSSLLSMQKPIVEKRQQINQANKRLSDEMVRSSKVKSNHSNLHNGITPPKNYHKSTAHVSKTVNGTVPNENIYENVIVRDMYPTVNDQRFEPEGCDHNDEIAANPIEQSKNDLKTYTNEARPDSMLVNIDDHVSSDDDDTIDDVDEDIVDVNFYCLTFTSNKPLIPLSRRKFSQQVKNSKKKKTSSNEGEIIYENCEIKSCGVKVNIDRQRQDETNSDEVIQSENIKDWAWKSSNGFSSYSDGMPMVNSQNLEIFDFEQDDVFNDEPDYTEVHSPEEENEDKRFTGIVPKSQPAVSHNTPPKIDLECPQVCVYDSNSLEMSYIGSRLKSDVSSVSSPSRSSNNSSQGIPDSRLRYNKPVTVTKTTSKEGTRLTLVKKNAGGSLELLITQDNCGDSENNNHTKLGKANLKLSKSTGSEDKKQQKSPKWSGLKRFGSKRLDSKPSKLIPKQTKPPPKPTFVSKILSGKLKRKSDPSKPKTPQKNNKDLSEVPVTISNIGSEVSAMHYGYKRPTNQNRDGLQVRNPLPESNLRFEITKKIKS